MKKFLIFIFFLIIINSLCLCQDGYQGTKYAIPGKEYEAGWFHELFFGAHWRDVWTTPIKVNVLDLNTFAGGLTPTKRGGGLQTKSLRFAGKDGKEYKFRSVNKDPKKVLDKELQQSIAADIIQDQISSSNPMAPLVVAPMLSAVGVYQTIPQLVIMPDDEKLGEYRKDFGGILGMLENVPDTSDYEGSDKVTSTVKMFDRFDKEQDEFVDSKEFLKARLMDIFFGDWDRHKDQWKWVRYEEDNKKIYRPIPLDRDQAFAEFDGLFPKIGESVVPQLNHFDDNYPNMKFMTWSGRYLDQRFLIYLTRREWDSVTNEVHSKLTDAVIEDAVRHLPPEVYPKIKDELLEKLKSRRDQLKDASAEYFELVNSISDIYATNKKDRLDVEFKGNKTIVALYKKKKEPGEEVKKPYHYKEFDNDINKEIRIYLKDDDDDAIIHGSGTGAPLIRVIGGEGKDELTDKSTEGVIFYDDGKKTKIKSPSSSSVDNSKYKEPQDSLEKVYDKVKDKLSDDQKEKMKDEIANLKYDQRQIDRGYMWASAPLLGYTPDTGPLLGGSLILYRYTFRTKPYDYRMQLTAGYAPDKKGITGLLLDYNSNFYGLIKNALTNLHIRKSGIEINNYFGQGNESVYNDSLYKVKYYSVHHEEYIFNPSFEFPLNKLFRFSTGAIVKYFRLKDNTNNIITDTSHNAMTSTIPGADKLTTIGLQAGVSLDGRDHPSAPLSGYYFKLSSIFFPKIFNNHQQFTKISGDVRGYLLMKTFTDISLALRVKGEKIFGKYPFFESAFIGGSGSLRGFSSQRFAGNASVTAQSELRIKLGKIYVLFPETVGLFIFGETGRVFTENDDSKRWHPTFGGGLNFSVISRDLTFSFALGKSKERTGFYFTTGYAY